MQDKLMYPHHVHGVDHNFHFSLWDNIELNTLMSLISDAISMCEGRLLSIFLI
jgi:hypothetical protein